MQNYPWLIKILPFVFVLMLLSFVVGCGAPYYENTFIIYEWHGEPDMVDMYVQNYCDYRV